MRIEPPKPRPINHLLWVVAFCLWACTAKTPTSIIPLDNSLSEGNYIEDKSDFNDNSERALPIIAVDISNFPEISLTNTAFYNQDGIEDHFLNILQNNGVNTIRLRLWVNPSSGHSTFEEVKNFSAQLKLAGFKTWLSVHYSDTWADPGQQLTPKSWQDLPFEILKDTVYQYTHRIVQEIQPDFIQIGNEINTGILHPYGSLVNEKASFLELMQIGIRAVRDASATLTSIPYKDAVDSTTVINSDASTQIIIHYAGIDDSTWFFEQVAELDYDIIGLSYYPIWHGKSLPTLENTLISLSQTLNKNVVIAETAYPFTLEWNDFTNNIVGSEDQLILPDFPPTKEGQRAFIQAIRELSGRVESGIGFCYWGAELISWKGPEATDASPWENQALFDFEQKAVPALSEFNAE